MVNRIRNKNIPLPNCIALHTFIEVLNWVGGFFLIHNIIRFLLLVFLEQQAAGFVLPAASAVIAELAAGLLPAHLVRQRKHCYAGTSAMGLSLLDQWC